MPTHKRCRPCRRRWRICPCTRSQRCWSQRWAWLSAGRGGSSISLWGERGLSPALTATYTDYPVGEVSAYTHTVAVRLRLLIKSCVTVLSGLLPGPWHWAWWVPHRRWKELSLGPVVGAPSSGRESLHMFPASAQQAGKSPSWRRSWPPPPHKRRHWCHPSSTASLDEQPTSASLTFLFQPF